MQPSQLAFCGNLEKNCCFIVRDIPWFLYCGLGCWSHTHLSQKRCRAKLKKKRRLCAWSKINANPVAWMNRWTGFAWFFCQFSLPSMGYLLSPRMVQLMMHSQPVSHHFESSQHFENSHATIRSNHLRTLLRLPLLSQSFHFHPHRPDTDCHVA